MRRRIENELGVADFRDGLADALAMDPNALCALNRAEAIATALKSVLTPPGVRARRTHPAAHATAGPGRGTRRLLVSVLQFHLQGSLVKKVMNDDDRIPFEEWSASFFQPADFPELCRRLLLSDEALEAFRRYCWESDCTCPFCGVCAAHIPGDCVGWEAGQAYWLSFERPGYHFPDARPARPIRGAPSRARSQPPSARGCHRCCAGARRRPPRSSRRN